VLPVQRVSLHRLESRVADDPAQLISGGVIPKLGVFSSRARDLARINTANADLISDEHENGAARQIPFDFFRLAPSVAQGRFLVPLVNARDFG
jgi:hypothetical protein